MVSFSLSMFYLSLILMLHGCLAQDYFLGKEGESCAVTCLARGLNCNMHIVTGNSTNLFTKLAVKCTPDTGPWNSHSQPGYVSGKGDPNFGKCLGFNDVPAGVLCGASSPAVSRLCRCDAPSKTKTTFGTGVSSGQIGTVESAIFQWVVAPGDVGVMTHFWITQGNPSGDQTLIRYYVDGELNASIAFEPSMACGVGFYDVSAPWGTKWFGKGAKDNGYFLNFRIPFQKSIVITAQHTTGTVGGFYMIVRGGTNLPLDFGGVKIPPTAKLNLFTVNRNFDPIEFVTIAQVKAGYSGVHFMHTLAVQSGNENFMEGCYHMLAGDEEFPGTVLSTGMEDYFDSAWYFNAGPFHLPVAGLTHIENSGGVLTFSAYRFHEMDPLTFTNGMTLLWRNGDIVDNAGIKCLIETGGRVVGSPTKSLVSSYAWVYTWAN